MFYKIDIPKYLEAANGDEISKNTFPYRTPSQMKVTASQYCAKFTGKHLCKSVYFIKFQNVSMQLY